MLKPSLMLVQKNLPPAYWQKLSSVHPWGNTPQVQVKGYEKDKDKVFEKIAKENSDDKSSGKKGGTLRRGWTSKTHEEAESGEKANAKAYADSLTIHHYGNTLVIEIVNPVEYASYVEYGHRTANHKGWVQGRFMLTISEQEIQNIAPKVLESKIKKFIGECLK